MHLKFQLIAMGLKLLLHFQVVSRAGLNVPRENSMQRQYLHDH